METGRLQGSGRIDTAIAIAQRSFPDGAETACLARADQFADALAAGTLIDGPILLVPDGDTPLPVVNAEVERMAPGRVVALGGEAAVSQAQLNGTAAGIDTARISGPSRLVAR